MNAIFAAPFLAIMLSQDVCTHCDAQPAEEWWERKVCPGTGAFGGDSLLSATIDLNHDVFFGNYTSFNAGYAVNDDVDVTVYGILWHTDFFSQFGLGAGSQIPGTGLWTEIGGGVNFKTYIPHNC